MNAKMPGVYLCVCVYMYMSINRTKQREYLDVHLSCTRARDETHTRVRASDSISAPGVREPSDQHI